jgi:CRP-like cAMP-binding protein
MMRAEEFKKGDVIITEGQRGSEAFVVEHGRVEVFRAGPRSCPWPFSPGERRRTSERRS